ncbi:DUF6714 family protein [Undibacterium sp. Ren11W]|uniref:DUF6714 family protein n=1 Tax=Undibacterium sp. Ren11W TaxID=3413045 RepID=UPI003BF06B0E
MPQSKSETQFINEMYLAFRDARQPSVDEITLHRCIECDDIRDTFEPYSVRNVPDEKVEWLARSLCFLSPITLRYYLPRCIEFDIINPNSWVGDSIIVFIRVQNVSDPYWAERHDEFSQNEREIVSEYLEILQARNDANIDDEQLTLALEIWEGKA